MKDIDFSDYVEVNPLAVAASKMLTDFYLKNGSPETPFSKHGKLVMNAIIAVWEECYPLDAKTWYDQRKEYQKNEMSITEQLSKHTGRSLASYPLPIYQMMKACFKGFDPAERKNCLKMIKEWPQFRFANKA